MINKRCAEILKSKYFDHIDLQFAGFINRISGCAAAPVELAAALTSRLCRDGHTCLPLNDYAGRDFYSVALNADPDLRGKKLMLPDAGEWIREIEKCDAVGTEGELKPLILSGSRLYLRRYYSYQKTIASRIADIAAARNNGVMPDGRGNMVNSKGEIVLEHKMISGYFPGQYSHEQRCAAEKALSSGFTVITGGPGTGKTTTVAKILALMLEADADKDICIKLAAPTGKAAARMKESITKSIDDLQLPGELADRMPREAQTLHRLLGAGMNGKHFRYNRQNPLTADVLIIDEASMIDIAMMARLCEALPEGIRLILLGDSNQLASVEPGSVLADLCASGKYAAKLTVSHRFGQNSPIKKLSTAINECRVDDALDFLSAGSADLFSENADSPDSAVLMQPLPSAAALESAAGISRNEQLSHTILEGYLEFFRAGNAEEKFRALESFRILCALRGGSFGMNNINRIAELIFKRHKFIYPIGSWYENLPVMISKNDYSLGLFNGDIGIVLSDGNDLKAWFPDGKGGYKKFSRFILPEYEKVFAMTVHKSQGSEFQTVALILPDDIDNPVLTRELVYTAVTRARKTVNIFGSKISFEAAVKKLTRRSSGLSELLAD